MWGQAAHRVWPPGIGHSGWVRGLTGPGGGGANAALARIGLAADQQRAGRFEPALAAWTDDGS